MVVNFFQGTEANPTVGDSKCVTYFPTLQETYQGVLMNITSGNFNPSFWIGVAQNTTVLINRYVQWMTYCEFGLLFTRIDNTIESLSGLTNAFFKFSIHFQQLQVSYVTKDPCQDCDGRLRERPMCFHDDRCWHDVQPCFRVHCS